MGSGQSQQQKQRAPDPYRAGGGGGLGGAPPPMPYMGATNQPPPMPNLGAPNALPPMDFKTAGPDPLSGQASQGFYGGGPIPTNGRLNGGGNSSLDQQLQQAIDRRADLMLQNANERTVNIPSANNAVTYYKAQATPVMKQPNIVYQAPNTYPQTHQTWPQQPQYPPNYQTTPSNSKSEMVEMMMLQNAQMHQMVMQQSMLGNLPNFRGGYGGGGYYPPPSSAYAVPMPVTQPQIQPVYQQQQQPLAIMPRMSPQQGQTRRTRYGTRVLHQNNPVLRRKLKRTLNVVWAIAVLRVLKYKNQAGRMGPKMSRNQMFDLKLKEVFAAIYRAYTESNNRVGNTLLQLMQTHNVDFGSIVDPSDAQKTQNAISLLTLAIENVVFGITQIMPPTGIIGTSDEKSGLLNMLKNGRIFPENYFWKVEEPFFQFGPDRRIVNLIHPQRQVILVGVFVGRVLVDNILRTPQRFRLSQQAPVPQVQKNVKIFNSCMILLYRRIPVGQRGVMRHPLELIDVTYDDSFMQGIFNRINATLARATDRLRGWSNEYVKKIEMFGA